MRFSNRTAVTAAAAILAGGMLTVGASAANASPVSASPVSAPAARASAPGHLVTLNITYDGKVRGHAVWSQDPDTVNDYPGDSMAADDVDADGYGINVHLSTGRLATTVGHDAPYYGPWVGGDLPENHTYTMQGCVENNGKEFYCTSKTTVIS